MAKNHFLHGYQVIMMLFSEGWRVSGLRQMLEILRSLNHMIRKLEISFIDCLSATMYLKKQPFYSVIVIKPSP